VKNSIQKKSVHKEKSESYHREDLKSALVAEALSFLKSHPAESLSLRELARRLKVSHMAPYRHFPTKEDLFAEIIEKGFKSLTQSFAQARAQAKDSFPFVFSAFGKAYIRFFLDNPEQARLMFSGLLCDPSKHISAYQAGQEAFDQLLQLIQWGQKTGQMKRKDDPHLLGLMIWSAVHGSAMLMLENQFSMIDNAPEVQVEKYVDFMSARILKGCQ
jgi:AcrR family transcriptional regulator